ncbi:MAG TPA: hypothetical protein DEP69_01820 [Acidimicrobiaceae bacterium]|nr:hypothetical protein [Acidimicrobiaceae bacterium]
MHEGDNALRSEMSERIDELRKETREEFGLLRRETREEFGLLRQELVTFRVEEFGAFRVEVTGVVSGSETRLSAHIDRLDLRLDGLVLEGQPA